MDSFTDFAQVAAKQAPVLPRPSRPTVGRPVLPGEYYICQERKKADVIRGVLERVWWTYYDAALIDQADETTRLTRLFVEPIGTGGKTKIWTNMTGAGVLPDPQEFIVHYVGCYFYPGVKGSGTYDDLVLLANNTMLNLIVNQKSYYETLSWDMPSGGGQIAYSQPASAGTVDLLYNGVQSQLALKRLRIPVFILKNQSFYWNVEIDPDAWAALTAATEAWIYITMHGELYRAIT